MRLASMHAKPVLQSGRRKAGLLQFSSTILVMLDMSMTANKAAQKRLAVSRMAGGMQIGTALIARVRAHRKAEGALQGWRGRRLRAKRVQRTQTGEAKGCTGSGLGHAKARAAS